MLVDALYVSLEDREEAFDGVGVGFTTSVFALVVTDNAVTGELSPYLGVVGGFVGHDIRVAPLGCFKAQRCAAG